MQANISHAAETLPILSKTALLGALLVFPACSPVSPAGGGSSPQDQIKAIMDLDGTTQPLDLAINEVTAWHGSGQPVSYDAIYDTTVGGGGVPLKATIGSINEAGGMTTMHFNVVPQKSELQMGNDYTGAASMTLDVNPSRRTFSVTFPAATGMLWKTGETVECLIGQSGEVIQVQASAYQGYPISESGSGLTASHGGKSVSGVIDRREIKAIDNIILRGGKWYAFGYAKGPGGSSVSWVLKKVKPRQ